MRELTEVTLKLAEHVHDICAEVGPMATFLVMTAVMQTLIRLEMDGGDSAQTREMLDLCERVLKKKPGEGPGQPS